MLRLVEANFTSAGKTDLGDRTPSGFLQVRHCDTLRSEGDDLGLQIVTHQKEFVPLKFLGGMNGQFCRRQREDQPPMAGVHCRKSEYVPAEGAISRCILAVEDYVRAKNHERSFFWLEYRLPQYSAILLNICQRGLRAEISLRSCGLHRRDTW